MSSGRDRFSSGLSVVTPAFNEVDNLPILYERLKKVLASLELDWEWVIIDDHSLDSTFEVISEIAHKDRRVRGLRFARNLGSHSAMACGLQYAKGNCAVIMAADLQDPPEVLPELVQKWREGAQVVWAVRSKRGGERLSTIGFSRLYYWLMRNIVGLKEMPPTGADFFLIDRRVMNAFQQFEESNVSILALITWMGFRQTSIIYDKQARHSGKSGWSLEKKIKLVIDSLTAFTYKPIRIMSIMGFVTAFLGLLYAIHVIRNALLGDPIQGWSSLMVVILVTGGIQMLMLGILGEYIWRTLSETRRRPRFIIEDVVGFDLETADKPLASG